MADARVEPACRHLLARGGVHSCRLAAGTTVDGVFACPSGCLFLEARSVDEAGWVQAPTERMSNTADALADLPKPKKPKKRKRT